MRSDTLLGIQVIDNSRYRYNTGARVGGQYSLTERPLRSRIRSDVIRNPVDASGFRKPSAYYARISDRALAQVRCESYNAPYYKYSINEMYWPVVLSENALKAILPSSTEADMVLVRALNNVADRKGSFAESAAEVISTAQGLAKNAVAIDRFLVALSRKNFKGMAKALGLKPQLKKVRDAAKRTRESGSTLGSAWLNYWFGLAPIVSDMVSIAAFLSGDAVHKKLRVKGASQTEFARNKTVDNSQFSGPMSSPRIERTETKTSTGFARCSLVYSISSESLRRLATFGAVDIPSTLWAIQPWTFAIDWLVPVSEILRAYTADSFLEFRGGTMTKVATYECRTDGFRKRKTGLLPTQGYYSLDGVPGLYTEKIVERTVYTSSPKPVTIWINDPFDLWKGITSLSLVATKLKP